MTVIWLDWNPDGRTWAARTFANLSFPLASGFELVEAIHHGEDLHSTYCGQHVGVVARRSSKATVFMLTRQDKVNGFLAGKPIRVPEEMECCQPPVHAVQSQVLSQPVVQLIFLGVQALDIPYMSLSREDKLLGRRCALNHGD